MTPAELGAELGSGSLRPAYLLAGSETLLRDDALRVLRDAILAPDAREFNHDRLEGESAAPGQLLDALGTLPVAGGRRLVELREPEARRGGKALVEALADALPALCAQEDTVLVVSAARIDRRARWVKAFREPAAVVACDPPRGNRALQGFLAAEARRAGVKLGPGVAEALIEAVGPQLLTLRSELEKAALHAGPGRPVAKGDVTATASAVAEEPIWELTDAIGQGRIPDALVVLRRLLAAGSPPPVLLGSLANHFRKLLRTRTGAPPPGHPFALRKLEEQAQRYSQARLRSCLEALHKVDEILKGRGSVAHEVALEHLVIGLAG